VAEVLLASYGLSKSFAVRGGFLRKHRGTTDAVKHVDLTIEIGERVGLVGESGCGKSTLARMFVGLLQPTEGQIRVHGNLLSDLRGEELRLARRRVQLIFQDPTNSLNPRMTVEEIISEPLIIHNLIPRKKRREHVAGLLRAVQLPAEYYLRVPRELSGGRAPAHWYSKGHCDRSAVAYL